MDFSGRNEGMRTNEGGYSNYGPTKEHGNSSFINEAISGAVRAYENHLRESGEKPTHPSMKEKLTGLAVGEVEKLIQTKGLGEMDATRARQMATQEAHRLADEKFSGTVGSGVM